MEVGGECESSAQHRPSLRFSRETKHGQDLGPQEHHVRPARVQVQQDIWANNGFGLPVFCSRAGIEGQSSISEILVFQT